MRRKTGGIALYLRLSREDDDGAASESIENQRRLLLRFAEETFAGQTHRQYIDEGYSGTTFERPGFSRLLDDIQSGAISTVVVKDLSRLGREYIQTGYYLENVFPRFGVRFIAVNDGIDSDKEEDADANRGLIVSFKNLINDEYARDISIKVKSALRAKKESGIYAAAFCRYGYIRAENGEVAEHPPEAAVVRAIFRWFLQGDSPKNIAGRLNDLAVLSPAAAKGTYSAYQNPRKGDGQWTYQSVRRILKSDCYGGKAALCTTRTISHKMHKSIKNSPDRQVIVPVPPIINEADFAEAAGRLRKGERAATLPHSAPSPVSRLLHCHTCGAKMHRKRGAAKQYFVCSTYKNEGKNSCFSHAIDANKLEKGILFCIENLKLANIYINLNSFCQNAQNTSCTAPTFIKYENGGFPAWVQKAKNSVVLASANQPQNIGCDNTRSPQDSADYMNFLSFQEKLRMQLYRILVENGRKGEDDAMLYPGCHSQSPLDFSYSIQVKKIEIINKEEVLLIIDL